MAEILLYYYKQSVKYLIKNIRVQWGLNFCISNYITVQIAFLSL